MERTGLTGGRYELPPHTFRPCGVMPTSGRDRVAGCEVVEVASGISKEISQTARLFAWLTDVGEISAVDDASIELFCDRLRQVPARFGASPQHFDRPVDDVIRAAVALNAPARDATTIARHRSRMMTLKLVDVPQIEERVGSGLGVHLDSAECAAIAGWGQRAGFLAVTRLGRVVEGMPLLAFDDVCSGVDPKALVRPAIEQARDAFAAISEQGRATVGTRHGDHVLRIIPGFWESLELT